MLWCMWCSVGAVVYVSGVGVVVQARQLFFEEEPFRVFSGNNNLSVACLGGLHVCLCFKSSFGPRHHHTHPDLIRWNSGHVT